jgi:hypothetical protein
MTKAAEVLVQPGQALVDRLLSGDPVIWRPAHDQLVARIWPRPAQQQRHAPEAAALMAVTAAREATQELCSGTPPTSTTPLARCDIGQPAQADCPLAPTDLPGVRPGVHRPPRQRHRLLAALPQTHLAGQGQVGDLTHLTTSHEGSPAMADHSHIQWTDATWNVASGCTKVSEGCRHCYIERTPPFRTQGRRFAGPRGAGEPGATTGVQLHPERLDWPLRWRRPRRVFVNSLSDLFFDARQVPDAYIAQVFAVMAATPWHTYQVLTKRPGRMAALLPRLPELINRTELALAEPRATVTAGRCSTSGWGHRWRTSWPPPCASPGCWPPPPRSGSCPASRCLAPST